MTESSVGQDFSDIKNTATSLWICSITGFVYSILLIYFLSSFAETIAWALVIFLEFFFLGGAGACFYKWHSVHALIKEDNFGGNNHVNKYTMESFSSICMGVGFAFAGCAIVYLGCMIYKYKHIKTAINVIDASAEFIIANPRVVIIPFVYFMVIIFIFLGWVYCMAAIISLNDIIQVQNVIPYSP